MKTYKSIFKLAFLALVAIPFTCNAEDYIETPEGRFYTTKRQTIEYSMTLNLSALFASYVSQNGGELPSNWNQLADAYQINLYELFDHVSPPMIERFSFIESDAKISELEGGKLLMINNYVVLYPKTGEERRFALYITPDKKIKTANLGEEEVQDILQKYDIKIPPPTPYKPKQKLSQTQPQEVLNNEQAPSVDRTEVVEIIDKKSLSSASGPTESTQETKSTPWWPWALFALIVAIVIIVAITRKRG